MKEKTEHLSKKFRPETNNKNDYIKKYEECRIFKVNPDQDPQVDDNLRDLVEETMNEKPNLKFNVRRKKIGGKLERDSKLGALGCPGVYDTRRSPMSLGAPLGSADPLGVCHPLRWPMDPYPQIPHLHTRPPKLPYPKRPQATPLTWKAALPIPQVHLPPKVILILPKQ